MLNTEVKEGNSSSEEDSPVKKGKIKIEITSENSGEDSSSVAEEEQSIQSCKEESKKVTKKRTPINNKERDGNTSIY